MRLLYFPFGKYLYLLLLPYRYNVLCPLNPFFALVSLVFVIGDCISTKLLA